MCTDDRLTSNLRKFLNGLIFATRHLVHFMFGSRVGFWGWQIEGHCFWLDQILDSGWNERMKEQLLGI